MTILDETNAFMCEHNAIPIIAHTLASTHDLTVKINAQMVLYLIASLDKNQGYVREARILPLLLSSISVPISISTTTNASTSPSTTTAHTLESRVVSSAALALSAMAKNEMNQTELCKGGVMEQLVRLLGAEDVEVRGKTMMVLTSCLVSPKCRERLQSLGAVKSILSSLQELPPTEHQLMANTVDCVNALAKDLSDRTEIILSNQGVATLVQLLHNEHLNVQKSACDTLYSLCVEEEARLQFYGSKGNPAVIGLLKSSSGEVARQAAWLISSIASSGNIQ